MRGEQIRQAIEQNLTRTGVVAREIVVQEDPYGGWQIAVVAEGLGGMLPQKRRELCLAGLEDL